MAFLFFLLLPLLTIGQRGAAESPLNGQWKGPLKVPGGSLNIFITIVPLSNGTFYAALDVPQQKVSRMPVQVTVAGSDVSFSIQQAGSSFAGKLSSNGKQLQGTWKQPGLTSPLLLEKSAAAPAVSFQGSSKPTGPYQQHSVTIPNRAGKLKLSATYTVPNGPGPFPAVVLVSDAGPHTRDVTVEGYRMFGTLADYLSRRGFAVLRYDDRGTGKSTGHYAAATTADLATDAQAALNWLRLQPRVTRSQVGMIGHGEGANVALLTAAHSKGPDFVVSLAGYGLQGVEVLRRQQGEIMRLIGATPTQVAAALKLHNEMVNIIRQTPNNDLARAKVGVLLRRNNTDIDYTMVKARANQLTSPWYRYFLDFDPTRTLPQVKCPVLVLNGLADLQVGASKNLPLLKRGLRANRRVASQKLPGVNHWFQPDPSEWTIVDGQRQPTFSPRALVTIQEWLAATCKVEKAPSPAGSPVLAKGSAR
ncbi:alpha/beta fold hydrolase [Hymenobacter sp. BT175]|uniref:alpha/beta hydrolase family protein n=1 Tax=Hymenobacter translucens TaxID=2886507 RepID=UPI001D0E370C|nr:alpha/beta fold hydrolase [Hymenobacter translucens]MCC2546169.1 alpha/beta fold hydrolase [Hymenobacter translucens]